MNAVDLMWALVGVVLVGWFVWPMARYQYLLWSEGRKATKDRQAEMDRLVPPLLSDDDDDNEDSSSEKAE